MNDLEKSLTSNTLEIFERVSSLECIKGLYLCGGTAQALMMQHRKSEDLDFELIGTRKERPALEAGKIINEISETFPGARREILGDDHFEMYVDGNVKLSFFRPRYPVPSLNTGFTHNNIVTPDLQELLGMKVFTTTVRSKFRDYYDIYSLLKEGLSLEKAVLYACKFSRFMVKSKTLYTNLLTPSLYSYEENFSLLSPKYDVKAVDIRDYISETIVKEKNSSVKMKR